MNPLFFKQIKWKATVLIATAAVTSIAITAYFVLSYRLKEPKTLPAASAKTNALDGVAALGYLEPQGEVIELFAPASSDGARVEQLLVQRGDRVKTGQVVAILDSRSRLEAALQQAQIKVSVAQAHLEQVKAGAKEGEILAQQAKLQGTKAELQGQINVQRATIANLKAQLQGEKLPKKQPSNGSKPS